mmetsp:Transcript_2533/g.6022  ORF Transcript_2533/g.6022 Transcript_2533/m.6022 type:complete len:213 (+) Transcript_2533:391-1029(+)
MGRRGPRRRQPRTRTARQRVVQARAIRRQPWRAAAGMAPLSLRSTRPRGQETLRRSGGSWSRARTPAPRTRAGARPTLSPLTGPRAMPSGGSWPPSPTGGTTASRGYRARSRRRWRSTRRLARQRRTSAGKPRRSRGRRQQESGRRTPTRPPRSARRPRSRRPLPLPRSRPPSSSSSPRRGPPGRGRRWVPPAPPMPRRGSARCLPLPRRPA